MANPRKLISTTGIGEGAVTLITAITAVEVSAITTSPDTYYAVSLSANNTVAKGTAADPLFGGISKVEADGLATVFYKGFLNFKYTSTPPVAGNSVTVHADGTVQAAVASSANTVVSVDTTAGTCVVLV